MSMTSRIRRGVAVCAALVCLAASTDARADLQVLDVDSNLERVQITLANDGSGPVSGQIRVEIEGQEGAVSAPYQLEAGQSGTFVVPVQGIEDEPIPIDVTFVITLTNALGDPLKSIVDDADPAG